MDEQDDDGTVQVRLGPQGSATIIAVPSGVLVYPNGIDVFAAGAEVDCIFIDDEGDMLGFSHGDTSWRAIPEAPEANMSTVSAFKKKGE